MKPSTIDLDPRHITRNVVVQDDGGCLDALASICKAHVICADPLFHKRAKAKTMTTFDKREEGFEKQFAHDEELKFKATARRNKMLGLWAAEKLGLSGAEADDYARAVVLAEFEQGGDSAVVAKIRGDLEAKGIEFKTVDKEPFRQKLRQAGFFNEWKQKYGDEAWSVLEKFTGKIA